MRRLQGGSSDEVNALLSTIPSLPMPFPSEVRVGAASWRATTTCPRQPSWSPELEVDTRSRFAPTRVARRYPHGKVVVANGVVVTDGHLDVSLGDMAADDVAVVAVQVTRDLTLGGLRLSLEWEDGSSPMTFPPSEEPGWYNVAHPIPAGITGPLRLRIEGLAPTVPVGVFHISLLKRDHAQGFSDPNAIAVPSPHANWVALIDSDTGDFIGLSEGRWRLPGSLAELELWQGQLWLTPRSGDPLLTPTSVIRAADRARRVGDWIILGERRFRVILGAIHPPQVSFSLGADAALARAERLWLITSGERRGLILTEPPQADGELALGVEPAWQPPAHPEFLRTVARALTEASAALPSDLETLDRTGEGWALHTRSDWLGVDVVVSDGRQFSVGLQPALGAPAATWNELAAALLKVAPWLRQRPTLPTSSWKLGELGRYSLTGTCHIDGWNLLLVRSRRPPEPKAGTAALVLWTDTKVRHVFPLAERKDHDIGRAARCQIGFADPYSCLSRMHARLSWLDERWHLRDLVSASGTWVNDQAVHRPEPLFHGDRIRMGTLHGVFIIVGTSPEASKQRDWEDRVDETLATLEASGP